MIHPGEKYQHIQDRTGQIGKDEPVFLLRASDIRMVPLMMIWLDLYGQSDNADPEKIKEVQDHCALTFDWQRKNGVK